jgi:hypothetical protein
MKALDKETECTNTPQKESEGVERCKEEERGRKGVDESPTINKPLQDDSGEILTLGSPAPRSAWPASPLMETVPANKLPLLQGTKSAREMVYMFGRVHQVYVCSVQWASKLERVPCQKLDTFWRNISTHR